MFSIDGKKYELKYTLEVVDMIEGTLDGRSLTQYIRTEALPLSILRAFVVFALIDDKKASVEPEKGVSLFDKLLQSLGLKGLQEIVLVAVMRDLGFLFRQGISGSSTMAETKTTAAKKK